MPVPLISEPLVLAYLLVFGVAALACFVSLPRAHASDDQVVLRESREKHGYEEAVLACFDTDSTWNLHVDEKLRRDLPDGSARVKVLSAPGAYEVNWWSPESGEGWEPVERGEFEDVNEPDEVSHLA